MINGDDETDLVEEGSSTMLFSCGDGGLSTKSWEIRPPCLLTRGECSGEESPNLGGGPRLRVDIRKEVGDIVGIVLIKIGG